MGEAVAVLGRSRAIPLLIAEELEFDPCDPSAVASRVLARATLDDLREWAHPLLVDHCRQAHRTARHKARSAVATASRWEPALRELLSRGEYVPGRGWIRFGDCSKEDCIAIAADHERRAAESRAIADKCRLTAAALKPGQVVRDLPPKKIKEVWG